MKLVPTAIDGVWLVQAEPVGDERGSFVRTFCRETFAAAGLDDRVAQCSLSRNHLAGTLRGMHYQAAPHAEAKLVRCTRGRVFDVALDLRPQSATHLRWVAHELSAERAEALYLGPGIAHGFITLEDECEVFYQISVPYEPSAARGVRWNDPAFAIAWPLEPRVISARDRAHPDFVASSRA